VLGRKLYHSVSKWEEFEGKKQIRGNVISKAPKVYYRYFGGLHPRHACDLTDGKPTLASVTLKTDSDGKQVSPLAPNVKISIHLMELGEMDENSHSLSLTLKLGAAWKPALAEVRRIRDKVHPHAVFANCLILIESYLSE
jgi:hypothetical protein